MKSVAYMLRRVAAWLDPSPDVFQIETAGFTASLPRGTTVEQALAILARLEEWDAPGTHDEADRGAW